MIKKLNVSNYALIDSLQVEPDAGLSILTGETGAGKSIILGALALATGGRADLSSLRDKERKCVIELTVDLSSMGLEGFFEENDLDFDPQTIIRREILPGGKSRAFVNDTPVLLDTLGALSAHLIDIHSQHQSLLLSRHDYRIRLTDNYANDAVSMTRYREAYGKYTRLKALLEELKGRQAELAKTQDYNRYLLEELDRAALKNADEQEELENLCARLSNIQQIKTDLFAAWQLMDGDESSVISRLSEIQSSLHRAGKFLSPEENLSERTESARIELKDISAQLSSLLSGLDDDPALLEKSNARLDTFYSLERKHQVSDLASLISIREKLRKDIAGSEQIDQEIEKAADELTAAQNDLHAAAEALTVARTKAAGALSAEISDTVRSLGMPNAEFRVEIAPAPAYGENGADQISFLFSANLGHPPAQVEKVASGGELSRIMLAVKYTLARKAQLPTIVFDEIDTGVSGDIADRMGRIMQDMSRHMQVIAITHLPQIASRGDVHYKVFKEEKDGTTVSRISLLSDQDRTRELAQMISGTNISEAALRHAGELLRQNEKK